MHGCVCTHYCFALWQYIYKACGWGVLCSCPRQGPCKCTIKFYLLAGPVYGNVWQPIDRWPNLCWAQIHSAISSRVLTLVLHACEILPALSKCQGAFLYNVDLVNHMHVSACYWHAMYMYLAQCKMHCPWTLLREGTVHIQVNFQYDHVAVSTPSTQLRDIQCVSCISVEWLFDADGLQGRTCPHCSGWGPLYYNNSYYLAHDEAYTLNSRCMSNIVLKNVSL